MKVLVLGTLLLQTLNAQTDGELPANETALDSNTVPTATADVILDPEFGADTTAGPGFTFPILSAIETPVESDPATQIASITGELATDVIEAPDTSSDVESAAAPDATVLPFDEECPASCYEGNSRLRRRQDVPSSNGGFAAFQWPGDTMKATADDDCSDDIPDWLLESSGRKREACQPVQRQECPEICYEATPGNNALDVGDVYTDENGNEYTEGSAEGDGGSTIYEYYDETTTNEYTNLDEYPDDTFTEQYPDDNFTEEYPDDTFTEEYPDDTFTEEYPDDTFTEEYPDDTFTEEYPDDTFTEEYPDDTFTEEYPDDTFTEEYPDDTFTEEYPDDTFTEEYPDDTFTEEYPEETTTEEGYPVVSSSKGYGNHSVSYTGGYGYNSKTTLVTSTKTAPPSGYGTPGYEGSTIAGICPKQCNPFDPAQNKCDITTSCTTTGKDKYYCACRAGFRTSAWNPKDFTKQFKFAAQPYVYVAPGEVCDQVCSDQTCTEVMMRPACQ